MDRAWIAEKVGEFIQTNFIYEEGVEIQDDQSLLETGVVDSTGILELVNFLEETFRISIEDEELIPANLDAVSKIADYVSGKLTG
ncbi:MAG: acyl carrier protein [Candidatus Zixiibacteriota bacterium]|nr:MAG: acyl carrier protein [candidate division Zixibacteria bacterium]